MKRLLSILLALVLTFSLAACGKDSGKDTGKETGKETEQEKETEKETGKESAEAGKIAKVGLGVTVSLAKSKDQDDKKMANAQSDTTVAAVALDADGKIVKVIIDTAQDVVPVKDGAFDAKLQFKTKKELKEDYGMKATSQKTGLGKEWYEQIEFLENYLVGKTADEVKNIPVDDKSAPTGADLKAGATIKIASYQKAIANAIANAVEVQKAEKIGLGIVTTFGHATKQKDAKGGASVQFEDNINMVALDADGKVVYSKTDVAQNTVAFTPEGKLDKFNAEGTTKLGLGEKYGMRATSAKAGIGKEWFEQAEAYDKWLVGKNKEDVSGMKLEKGKATDADLKAGVTITISDFQAATVEAFGVTK